MTRAFVVGNGVSLKEMDLDLLIGEVTFGMNRIDLIYEPAPDYGISGTDWRPTYYLYVEAYWEHNPKAVPPSGPEKNPFESFVIPHHIFPNVECCIIARRFEQMYSETRNAHKKWRTKKINPIQWITFDCLHRGMDILNQFKPKEWHLPTPCLFGGTASVGMQFAFNMGYDPVILVGCDLDFKPIFRSSVADPNHFHPEYWTYDDGDLKKRDETLVHVHQMAEDYSKKHGRKILNATKGGLLEVHKRVKYEKLF